MEMNQQMAFPETFEGFAKEYGFKDDKEVYTNGSDLIPIFRVKQWLEQDNKLRTIEIDAAYECGKHANKWIPVSERLPEETGTYMTTIDYGENGLVTGQRYYYGIGLKWNDECVIAWQPLPQPYKAESEDDEEQPQADKGVLEKINEKQDSLKATCKAWDEAIQKDGYVN